MDYLGYYGRRSSVLHTFGCTLQRTCCLHRFTVPHSIAVLLHPSGLPCCRCILHTAATTLPHHHACPPGAYYQPYSTLPSRSSFWCYRCLPPCRSSCSCWFIPTKPTHATVLTWFYSAHALYLHYMASSLPRPSHCLLLPVLLGGDGTGYHTTAVTMLPPSFLTYAFRLRPSTTYHYTATTCLRLCMPAAHGVTRCLHCAAHFAAVALLPLPPAPDIPFACLLYTVVLNCAVTIIAR